jgi:hypothetical protein
MSFEDRLTSAYLGLYLKVEIARSSCALIHAKRPKQRLRIVHVIKGGTESGQWSSVLY